MVWLITKREFLENLTSLKFAIATILCLIIVLFSFFVSTKDYERRLSEYQSAVNKQKGWDAVIFPKVYRKPEILSIFNHGFDRRLGNMFDGLTYKSGHLQLKTTGAMKTGRHSSYLASLAEVDFTFVVRIILSLLAIFLAYDAVSGEREAGTLKLTLANSVKRSTLLLGKFLGGILCLNIPLALSTIIGLLMVQSFGLVFFDNEEWIRIGCIFGISSLYLTAFFALGLFVSCRTKEAATTLLVLLLLWICLLIIVPNISPILAQQLQPLPPAKEYLAKRRDLQEQLISSALRSDDVYRGLNRKMPEALWQYDGAFWNKLIHQASLARSLTRISPGFVYSYAIEAITRTGTDTYSQFMRQAHAYVKELALIPVELPREETDRLAITFQYRFQFKESFSESLSNVLLDILLLFLFNLFFFMGAHISFLRYQVSN